MRKFDWFSRRRHVQSAADLREALIAACSARQYDVMTQLINANATAIRESFPNWRTVPQEMRDDPEALERYGKTLLIVARVF